MIQKLVAKSTWEPLMVRAALGLCVIVAALPDGGPRFLFSSDAMAQAEDEGTDGSEAGTDSSSNEARPTAPSGVSLATPQGSGKLLGARRKGEPIVSIKVRGNRKVEADAIRTILKTRQGDPLNLRRVQQDIEVLFELNYFSDVRVFVADAPGGVELTYQVAERPAITKIEFRGMKEVTEDSLKDKLKVKLYTIVNEADIAADMRLIEKEYADKGFYLARVSRSLEAAGPHEVSLVFNVDEGSEVKVGSVFILGNQFFTDGQIIGDLALRPFARSSAYSSSASPGASLFKEEFLRRDTQFLSYLYRDNGFEEVKVAKPLTAIDTDREFVRITFEVEEGIQYNVGTIDVSGDVLFPKEELFEAMKLKPGKLWRYSQFTADVEMLVEKYGDLGYANVDVNPKTTFNREAKTIDINYEITKGEKVYFGTMTVVGNTKTRDNVVRREMGIAESELYSGTRLSQSKRDVERLGFFEEVQVIRSYDEEDKNLMHLKVKVKEKPTGQLQAALGFTPAQGGAENNLFGQGRFDEKNFGGRAWETNLTGRWNGGRNYELSSDFFNPRVNDSHWSFGLGAFYKNSVRTILEDVDVQERTFGGNVSVGRRIIELIRGTLTYQLEDIKQTTDAYLLASLRDQGVFSSLIFRLSRSDLDNRLDPTEGSDVSLAQRLTGIGFLGGNYKFYESTASASYFVPLDFTDKFRTHFRLFGQGSYIYPAEGERVPLSKRYALGGPDDMRGFEFRSIGPTYSVLQAPGDRARPFVKGGDKRLLFQLEYFIPLIPEAGIKSVLFHDWGRVFDDSEALEFGNFERDFGFGFRWITPIAPFRFEWAYPVIDGKPGDAKFIFYIGY